MKALIIPTAMALVLGSCGKREAVVASETRPVTMRDENLKLDVSSAERFGQGAATPPIMGAPTEPGQSPLVPSAVPDGWEEAETSAFRLLNYRFGTAGEVYVSLSQGGVFDNANRWLGQFGAPPMDAAAMEVLEEVQLPGFRGVWVSAEGRYASGMGQPPRDGYGLAGIVTSGAQGVFTVKMVGPAAEVAAEKDRLRQFVASLKPVK